MKSYWAYFSTGVVTTLVVKMVYEDMLGKERYLKVVDAAWVETPVWFMVLVVCLMCFAIALELTAYNINKERYEKLKQEKVDAVNKRRDEIMEAWKK